MNPLLVINRAIRAVPAMRYALAVAGLAAVVAIGLAFKGVQPNVLLGGMCVVVGFMFVLLIFAHVATPSATDPSRSSHLLLPAKVLVWFYTVAIVLLTVSLGYKYLWAPSPPLPTGSVVLFDGFKQFKNSTFAFDGGEVGPWYWHDADIGVFNDPKDDDPNAELFLMNNREPYVDHSKPDERPANAGITDMHARDLSRVSEAPLSGYKATDFKPEVGHVYCVKTRDGKHFAKIRVTDVEVDRIAFDFVFQPNGSNRF